MGSGGRTNSFPSVDIANGAPFGDDPSTAADEGGPDTIGLNWPDARNGLNNEEAPVQFSDDKGESWTDPVDLTDGTDAENGDRVGDDRPDFPAIALSPDGTEPLRHLHGILDPSAPRPTRPVAPRESCATQISIPTRRRCPDWPR